MFTKGETKAVLVILLLLGIATLLNLRISLTKARDAQRKADVRSIYDALNQYAADFGFYPKSSDEGKILACNPTQVDDKGDVVFSPCEWYQDSLRDLFDESYPAYLESIPGDPRQGQGRSYFYVSNGSSYQIFASLESSTEDEYEESIAERNLSCGEYTCNFGRASGKVPLDVTLEEYEVSLQEDTIN